MHYHQTDYMLDDPGFWSNCQEQEIYLSKMSRPIPGSTQLCTWFVWGFFPLGYSDWGVMLTTYLHLVPRLRITHFMPSWYV